MQRVVAILSSVAYTTLQYFFPHFLTNCTIFEKKLLNIKRVFRFSLQLLSETFPILGTNERDMIKKMYIGMPVNYPLFLPEFNGT